MSEIHEKGIFSPDEKKYITSLLTEQPSYTIPEAEAMLEMHLDSENVAINSSVTLKLHMLTQRGFTRFHLD